MTVTGVPISSLPNGVIFNKITVEARGQTIDALVPAIGASVIVYVHQAGYVPTTESERASVYLDELLTTPLAQPVTTDANGNVPGYVASNQMLDLVASGGNLPSDQVLFLNSNGSVVAVSLDGDVTGTPGATEVSTVKGGRTPLTADQNLADVLDASAARGHLGLGSASTHDVSFFDGTGAAAAAQSAAESAASTATSAEASRAEAAEAARILSSALGQPSGAAKVGSDGYVGGTSGTPLSPSVVTSSSPNTTAQQLTGKSLAFSIALGG